MDKNTAFKFHKQKMLMITKIITTKFKQKFGNAKQLQHIDVGN